jgi:acetyl esterase
MAPRASFKFGLIAFLASRKLAPVEKGRTRPPARGSVEIRNRPRDPDRQATDRRPVHRRHGGRLTVRRDVPQGAKPGRTAFFHGGGWMLGSIETHDYLAATIALQSGHEVMSVQYRLAPEHPFTAGLEDCLAVTRPLAATGKVAVAGDSSGGNLAAVVANELPVLAQFLMYPVTDSAHEAPSYDLYPADHVLTRDTMRYFRHAYAPDPTTHASPWVSPLRHPDPARTAPALISVAQCDILRDEGAAHADRLRDAGVEVVFEDVTGAVHAFATLLGLNEAQKTVKRRSKWLASKLA